VIAFTLAELAAVLGGRLLHAPDGDVFVEGEVHTDSRKVVAGSIFYALPGEVTDGHLFAAMAGERGAVLLVVERELELDVPQVLVPESRRRHGFER
jgi:UDP-N-acetylmuramoyl-tripeptide--D-alanyl-D-alanine ligase